MAWTAHYAAFMPLTQPLEEGPGGLLFEFEREGRLHQQRPELRAQAGDLGEESFEQRLRATQPPLVRSRARQLDRELNPSGVSTAHFG